MRLIAMTIAAGFVFMTGQSPLLAQQVYPTPEAAAKDLIDSARANAPGFGNRILGASGADLLRSGDPEEDAENLADFNEAAAEAMALDEKGPDTRVLRIGLRGWTFPLPIVKKGAGWQYDVEQGRTEVTNRLIGFNELSAIGACRAYIKAQDEYFSRDRDADAVREYAQRIISTPGQRDGLYWDPSDPTDISPLDDFVTELRQKPGTRTEGSYNGYVYRVLKAQGAAAPGGAHSYLVNGFMIAGYALVAWPLEWGKTGIQTFLCGQNGVVFQKNLGRATGSLGPKITSYNPDSSWARVQD